MAIKDEVGNRYGHLKVIKYAYTHPKRRCAFWLCQCDCGKQIILEGIQIPTECLFFGLYLSIYP